jgi:hypothetical protein
VQVLKKYDGFELQPDVCTPTLYEPPGVTEILFLYDKAPPQIVAVATVTTETEVTPAGATHVYEVPLPV